MKTSILSLFTSLALAQSADQSIGSLITDELLQSSSSTTILRATGPTATGYNCFHVSTQITVRRNDEEVVTPLDEVKVGEQVLTFDFESQLFAYEPVTDMSKINNEDFSSVLFEVDFASEDITGTLALTPGHYVFIRRNNEAIQHIPSEDIFIGDEFLHVHPSSAWVKVVAARAVVIPSSQVIHVETPSKTIVANGLLSSCVAWWQTCNGNVTCLEEGSKDLIYRKEIEVLA